MENTHKTIEPKFEIKGNIYKSVEPVEVSIENRYENLIDLIELIVNETMLLTPSISQFADNLFATKLIFNNGKIYIILSNIELHFRQTLNLRDVKYNLDLIKQYVDNYKVCYEIIIDKELTNMEYSNLESQTEYDYYMDMKRGY